MSFDPITAPTDYILLAGRRSPGLADIVGASSPRNWDERRGYGLSGATLRFRGVGLAHFRVMLRLYSAQDWLDWHDWRPLVQRPPLGERAQAQDIWHPILEDLEIRSAVVEDVIQPIQTADGEWTAEIRFIEFRRPVFALAAVEASAQRPTDPVDLYIEQLSAQVNVLAAGAG